MRVTQDLYAFLCVATLLGFNCEAGFRLPAPGNLSYEWLDAFTVNVSWEKPGNLTEGCDVKYEINLNKGTSNEQQIQTDNTHYVGRFLTEEMGGGQWEVTVEAFDCKGERSRPENITVRTRKPQAEMVDDFKCIVQVSQANCSWIPKDPSHNMSLSYRICGKGKKHLKDLTECDGHYSDGRRRGCRVRAHWAHDDVCMKLENEAGLKTFEMERVIAPPKMSVSADRDSLNLTWARPDVAENCDWEYQVSYKECGEQKHRNYTETRRASEHGPLRITYRQNCRYEFRFKASTHVSCRTVRSDGYGSQTFGTETRAESLMSAIWVACGLSAVLSVTLVLSCYCARRHRAILCPVIPDPSAMFKEMMMNGSKELKAATTLYEPVPEAVEPCKITLATENGAPPEKS